MSKNKESRPTSSQPQTGMTQKPSFAVRKKKNNKKGKKVRPDPDFVVMERLRRLKVLLPPSGKGGKLTQKEIPFYKEVFSKGTQAPTIRLYFTTQVVSISTNALAISMNLDLSIMVDETDWTSVFSEFRYIGGQVEYRPFQSTSSNVTGQVEPCLGAITYRDSDNGTPSSYANLLSYDTKKWFIPVLVGSYGDTKLHATIWPVLLDFVPDQQWLPIDDVGTTIPARFKLYGSVVGNDTVQCGSINGFMDIQFRGLQ